MPPEIVLSEDPEVGAGEADPDAIALPRFRGRIDAYADEALPGKNFGDRVKLKLNGGTGTDDAQAFIFIARPFPFGATIVEATLKVYLAGAWGGSQTITAKRVIDPWKEGRLTWDRRPDVIGANSADAAVTAGSDKAEVTFDLAPMLGDVSAGNPWFGVRLELDANSTRKLWSSEAPDVSLRPVLEIDWIVPPLPPTELSPAGGRSISLAKPTVSWRFRDPENEDQSASQIQIATDEDFASIEYDSGKVANTESQWDLAATAYAGVPDAGHRWWRVKVWDEGDLPSEWSDAVDFYRRTKGVLTIVNPAEAPDDFVEETTPSIDWTFTGRTQRRATVLLLALDDLGAPIGWSEAWRVEEETSVTVPPGILHSATAEVSGFRVIVRVWDDFARESLPDDPAYVEASRDFTYERSGTPTAVATLTAVPDEAKVVLTFTRATQPDWFSLRVDGKEVEQRLDPEDVFVAGTTYVFDWWRARPGVESTYEVEAVVYNAGTLEHSDGNATADATTRPRGKWLVDDDEFPNLAIQILGAEQADLQIVETAETFRLIGQRKPVRITDSIGGHEGGISGILLDPTVADDFEELKGRLKPLRLIFKQLNIPVMLGETSCVPVTGQMGGTHQMSAQVMQVGEFFDVKGG